MLRWRSAPYLKYDVLAAAEADSAFRIVASNLTAAGNVTAWTNHATAERGFYRVEIVPQ